MNSNVEIVKRLNAACMSKDFKTIESMLHSEFTFKDPTMSLNSPKEYIEFMRNCPFDGNLEEPMIMADGDKVIQIINCNMTEPVKFTIQMCDILTFKDGKLYAEDVIYDTAQLPSEAKDMQTVAAKNKKAA